MRTAARHGDDAAFRDARHFAGKRFRGRTARNTLTRLGPPEGLRIYVTGPGATIADEFTCHRSSDAGYHRSDRRTDPAAVADRVPLPHRRGDPTGVRRRCTRRGPAVVAALGDAGLVEVSLFSVALLAAMMLGAGTDYAIFLIGRYHEGRRRGVPRNESLVDAYRGVASVIAGSALTIAAALACFNFARCRMLRSTGIPCAIGVLAAMLSSLTLTPALISLAGRLGWLEPRRSVITRRWRQIGCSWHAGQRRFSRPAPRDPRRSASAAALLIGWNEPAATPATAESSGGYAAADRHFPANHLLPTVVTVATDHDIRNPAGLIAVERITRGIMAIPGVRMVQSASRPAGTVPDEASLSGQAGVIGRQFNDTLDAVNERLGRVADLDAALASMTTAVGRFRWPAGQRRRPEHDRLRRRRHADRHGRDPDECDDRVGVPRPAAAFMSSTPDCAANPICSVVGRVVQPVDDVMRSSAQLASGADKLTGGSATGDQAMAGSARSRELHDSPVATGPRRHRRPHRAREFARAATAPADRLPPGARHAVSRQRRRRLLPAAASVVRSSAASRSGQARLGRRPRPLHAGLRRWP